MIRLLIDLLNCKLFLLDQTGLFLIRLFTMKIPFNFNKISTNAVDPHSVETYKYIISNNIAQQFIVSTNKISNCTVKKDCKPQNSEI